MTVIKVIFKRRDKTCLRCSAIQGSNQAFSSIPGSLELWENKAFPTLECATL